MLALPILIRRLCRPVNSIVLLTTCSLSPLYGFEYADGRNAMPKHLEQEWVSRYFNSLDEETSIEEALLHKSGFGLSPDVRLLK